MSDDRSDSKHYPPTGEMAYVACAACQKREVATFYRVDDRRWVVPPRNWLVRSTHGMMTYACSPDCALEVA